MKRGIRLACVVLVSCSVLPAAHGQAPGPQSSPNAFQSSMDAIRKQDETDQRNPYRNLQDPCILVGRAEAEKVLGALAGDPYRARDDGSADPGGPDCFYRAANGHSFFVHPEYRGGKATLKMMGAMGGLTAQAMRDQSHDADLVDGDWDDQRWNPPAKITALKGDVLIEVDVAGADGKPSTAGKLADIAFQRLPRPLAYDGAAAARRAPGPLVSPRDPCSLVTTEEARAILGPSLAGAPHATRGGCIYPLVKKGPLDSGELGLSVKWSGGFAQMKGMLARFKEVVAQTPTQYAHGTAEEGPSGGKVTVETKTVTTDKVQEDLRKVKGDPGYQSMLQGMDRMLGGGLSTSMRDPGATMRAERIEGPWEEGYIVGGTGVTAVKKDVLVGVDGRGLDVDKARAMVAKAMSGI